MASATSSSATLLHFFRLDSTWGTAPRFSWRAREEMATWREYDYLIVNRDLKDAVDQLATVIQAERCRVSRLSLEFPDLGLS